MRLGRLDIEARKASPADWNAAAFDVGGINNDAKQEKGGLCEFRLPWPRLVVTVIVWTQLAADLGQAFNAAIWRRVDRQRTK